MNHVRQWSGPSLAPDAIRMMHDDYEAPRYVMVSARVSPMVELARWLFERHRIPYEEQAHAPLLHVLFLSLIHI